METVHSSMHNDEPVIWDFALKRLTEAGMKFLKYLETAFMQNGKVAGITKNTSLQISGILRNLTVIYTKLKKALIYTQYSLKIEDIETLNKIISNITKFSDIFCVPDRKYRLNPETEKILFKKQTDILDAMYVNIKTIASEYIDVQANKMLFTGKSWPEKSVMIGSLRNSKQLQIALEHDFYHVPKSVCENPQSIKCIAIYQSKNLFGRNAGIKYYGKVLTYAEVARYEINEIPSSSKEMYYRFEIETWKSLKTAIKADALGEVATFTSLYQFLTAEKTSELHLDSKVEYELFDFMKTWAFTPYPAHISLGNVTVAYSENTFEIYDNDTVKFKFSSEDFYKNGVIRAKQASAMIQAVLD